MLSLIAERWMVEESQLVKNTFGGRSVPETTGKVIFSSIEGWEAVRGSPPGWIRYPILRQGG